MFWSKANKGIVLFLLLLSKSEKYRPERNSRVSNTLYIYALEKHAVLRSSLLYEAIVKLTF